LVIDDDVIIDTLQLELRVELPMYFFNNVIMGPLQYLIGAACQSLISLACICPICQGSEMLALGF
jgi:hypothetical protein